MHFLLLKLIMLVQHSLMSLIDAPNPVELMQNLEALAAKKNYLKPTDNKSKRSKTKKRTSSMLLSMDSKNEEEIDSFPQAPSASTAPI